MPYKPMRPCSFPGCPNLTDGKYCEEHKSKASKERPSAGKRGYNSRWQKESKKFLETHPLCVLCLEDHKVTEATVVDHIIPHRGDMTLFWDKNNWQALCKHCHDVKTMTEDRYQEYRY